MNKILIITIFTYINVESFNCSEDVSKCINGICNNTICICYPSYLTYNPTIQQYKLYCNYKQYSAHNAYIYQGLFGFIGLGYHYIGLHLKGFILSLMSFIFIIASVLYYKNIKYSNSLFMSFVFTFSFVVFFLIVVIWWIYSVVEFKNMKINDTNDMPLYNDMQ
jgi:hypothetical protein